LGSAKLTRSNLSRINETPRVVLHEPQAKRHRWYIKSIWLSEREARGA